MTTLNTIIEEENTPDTEWEKTVRGKVRSAMYLAECHELQYQAVEPVVFELLSSRDTYWKERVGEAVKAERDRIAEAAIEIAIKRVQDVLCNYADDNIEDEKLNRIWFKAVVKKALTPITNEDNLK